MRPINLKISAFGPYAGAVDIHMEDLGEKGLYLITGDTGAGKTTIFDAICYALFGEASGENRTANMFRSMYADPSTPTFVELTFSHNGKEYVVRRNPDYVRPAKRGGGTTTEKASAELHYPNGDVVTKTNDVTRAIEELLSVNKDQFSQIAMLAQGDFLKLLLADTKDRIKIFRELFKTGYFLELQNRLDEKFRETYREVQDGRKAIDQYITGIQYDNDDVLSVDAKKAVNLEFKTSDVMELLDKLIDKDNDRDESIRKELDKINAELEQINNRIGAADALEKTKAELEIAKAELADREPRVNVLSKEFDSAKAALKDKTGYEKDVATIAAELGNYDEADTLTKDIAGNTNALDKNKSEITRLSRSLEESRENQTNLKEEEASLKNVGAEVEKAKAELDKVAETQDSMKELRDELDTYHREERALDSAREKYRLADEFFASVNRDTEAMEQNFFDGQAGILAERLKEGEKCPVCGSTTHPSLAKRSAEVPTEAELNQARKKRDQARKERESCSLHASGLSKALEAKASELIKRTAKLLDTEDLKEAADKVITAMDSIRSQGLELKNKYAVLKDKANRLSQLAGEIKLADDKITALSAELEEKKRLSAGLESGLKEKNSRLITLKEQLKFENKGAALSEMNSLNEKAAKLQAAYDKADAELKSETAKITALKAAIEGHRKTIESAKVTDVTADRIRQKELGEQQQEVIDRGQVIASRIRANENIKRHIEKESSRLSDTEARYSWLKALSDTASGKISGKDKITLETYIQTTYFSRIIKRANIRLMTMSGGQYELKRMEEASSGSIKSGLELSVIDHTNGSERSVKSLSGGESFMASLSLALGLSEEVQSSAGGIQIETMFVDEGFGSLDPDSLEQAYRALCGLSDGNRLVGIISHVADLKDKIDHQIVVTKDKATGSSSVKLVC